MAEEFREGRDFGEVYQSSSIEERQYLEKVKEYLKRQIYEEGRRIFYEIQELKKLKERMAESEFDRLFKPLYAQKFDDINLELYLIEEKETLLNFDEEGSCTYDILKEYAMRKIERSEISPELKEAIQNLRKYFEYRRDRLKSRKDNLQIIEGEKNERDKSQILFSYDHLEAKIKQLDEFIRELDSLGRKLERVQN